MTRKQTQSLPDFYKAQARQVNIALSNTFGFGGHNCSIILGRVS